MDKCPDCDAPLPTPDLDEHDSGCGCPRCPNVCWREANGGFCTRPPVDWRARALAAEARYEDAARLAAASQAARAEAVKRERAAVYAEVQLPMGPCGHPTVARAFSGQPGECGKMWCQWCASIADARRAEAARLVEGLKANRNALVDAIDNAVPELWEGIHRLSKTGPLPYPEYGRIAIVQRMVNAVLAAIEEAARGTP